MSAVTVETSWPPKSPHEALLSSPSGRGKYREMQDRRQRSLSPLKRSATTPDFGSRSRRLHETNDDGDEEDEDEETLQLKLAAIEAKLKLKKLQHAKTKPAVTSSGIENENFKSRPSSAAGSSRPPSRFLEDRDRRILQAASQNNVQVPLSPTKRPTPTIEPRSPGRALLSINKGLKGRDVSLRRAPNVRDKERDADPFSRVRDGTSSRTSAYGSVRSTKSISDQGISRAKSFSERMAESRSDAKDRREKSEQISRNRSTGFVLDKAEMGRFQVAAAECRSHTPLRSPTKNRPKEDFSREDVLRAYHQPNGGLLHRSNTTPSLRNQDAEPAPSARGQYSRPQAEPKPPHPSRPPASVARHTPQPSRSTQDTDSDSTPDTPQAQPDSSLFDPFSLHHLSKRILPHTFITRTLENKEPLRIPDLLRDVKAPHYEPPSTITGDYVVFGIVGSKSTPKTRKGGPNNSQAVRTNADKWEEKWDTGTANESQYLILTLTDLTWTLDLFLFRTAFPRYYRLTPGTLIAIFNPAIMPPPKHKADTNRFSLVLSSSYDTVLEIGTARDLGFCKAIKNDGKGCEAWINSVKTEWCDFHVDNAVRKTQAGRMGVNGGVGMFGPGGRSGSRTGNFGGGGTSRRAWNPKQGGEKEGGRSYGLKSRDGSHYDSWTQSSYLVAPSVPGGRRSAVRLIDEDDDDLFTAGVRRGGDKEERLRKRLVEHERERDIARKLGSGAAGVGVGGLGKEYMRLREERNQDGGDENANPNAAARAMTTMNKSVEASLGLESGKRKADQVKLGPVNTVKTKKTRFVTEKGIREAGRESLGAAVQANAGDEDDELDIV